MDRRETVSVQISDIEDCVRDLVFKKFPELKDKDVVELEYASKTTFLLFNVRRKCDLAENPNAKFSDKELIEKGYTPDAIKSLRNMKYYK